jgi:hypothetical protein
MELIRTYNQFLIKLLLKLLIKLVLTRLKKSKYNVNMKMKIIINYSLEGGTFLSKLMIMIIDYIIMEVLVCQF